MWDKSQGINDLANASTHNDPHVLSLFLSLYITIRMRLIAHIKHPYASCGVHSVCVTTFTYNLALCKVHATFGGTWMRLLPCPHLAPRVTKVTFNMSHMSVSQFANVRPLWYI